MEFTSRAEQIDKIQTDLLVARFFEGSKTLDPLIKKLDAALGKRISNVFARKDFRGKLGENLLLDTEKTIAAPRVLFLGLGKKNEFTLESLRVSIAAASSVIQRFRIKNVAFALLPVLPQKSSVEESTQTIVESLLLSNYKFLPYKKMDEENPPVEIRNIQFILSKPGDRIKVLKGAKVGSALAQTVNLARDLGNHPSNIATPSHLARHALDLAKAHPKSVKTKILHRGEIKKENLNGLLAVSQGSDEEPKFIILEYQGGRKTAQPVVLVGKGITFDSGGISIKPSDKMEEMKYDMMGAATVMGIIRAAAELKLPLNLVGLIPATENLPSGKAVKPGDIIRSRSGKTIEVVNTDAEGRMILADALDYAKKYKPALVIDFATLTGAIVVALGDDLIGAFSNKESLIAPLKAAADMTGEKIWPMPLEKSYEEFIKSDFADLRNISSQPRIGDAIHAANFLKNFVDYPWIHLDIAGTAWATREKPYRPKGATGIGIRLAIEFLKRLKK